MINSTKEKDWDPCLDWDLWIKKELSSILYEEKKFSSKTIRNEYEFSRFCRPSQEWIKEIPKIENIIIDNLNEDFDLIRVSPLVPKWIYNFLSGMSLNRSIKTNRWFEVCSDLSVSLALEWFMRRKNKNDKKIHNIWWFNTTVRPQSFYWCNNQKNVPYIHFSMYGNAIVGQEWKEFFFTKKHLPKLIQHYLNIIEWLNKDNFLIEDIEVHISDIEHTRQILGKSSESINKLRDYQLRERTKSWKEPSINDYLWTNIIQYHDSIASLDNEVNKNNLWLSLWYLISIFNELEKLKEKFPIKIKFMLWRSRWAWQYSSIAFSMFAKNKNWEVMDIADWGVTNRWEKLLNEKERCIVGGLWMDLLAKLYIK